MKDLKFTIDVHVKTQEDLELFQKKIKGMVNILVGARLSSLTDSKGNLINGAIFEVLSTTENNLKDYFADDGTPKV